MDSLLEKISNLIPLGNLFETIGWNKDLGEIIAFGFVLILAALFIHAANKLRERYNNAIAAKNLMPQFDIYSINNATKYYIPTKFQNASPARQDEPSFTHQFVSSNPLIPFFIKKAFVDKNESERFYIILGDSGMGKSTFLINLYLQYNSFFNWKKTYKMRLLRFSHPDTMEIIKSVDREESIKTILLLDALDEDPQIVSMDANISSANAFNNRIKEIIEATRNYREVVLTCRTQYFPGQEDNPYELSIKRPDERGYYTLNKIYISPFSDQEVRTYLNKKFGYFPILHRKNKNRAIKVVQKSRYLVIRPMLLSYIDYLIDGEQTFDSIYSIYELLITKWLVREGEKRKGRQEVDIFITNLRRVSEKCAFQIALNLTNEGRAFLTESEAIIISKKQNINLRPEEVMGQSLLTCDGSGNWKFAHKSILEFFLAERAILDIHFFQSFNFSGMDMSLRFFEERNALGLKMAFLDRELRDSEKINPFELSENSHKIVWIPDKPIVDIILDEYYFPLNDTDTEDVVFSFTTFGKEFYWLMNKSEPEATLTTIKDHCSALNKMYDTLATQPNILIDTEFNPSKRWRFRAITTSDLLIVPKDLQYKPFIILEREE